MVDHESRKGAQGIESQVDKVGISGRAIYVDGQWIRSEIDDWRSWSGVCHLSVEGDARRG
jgi:hypothetical protein